VHRFKVLQLLRWLPFTALLFAVQALGQFEVAPDHFDADAQKPPPQRVLAKADHKRALSVALDGAQGRSQRRAASAHASPRAVTSSPVAGVPPANTSPLSTTAISRGKQRPRSGAVASLRSIQPISNTNKGEVE
jgi:hypothetical protein